jgi:S1-C subfamily serine protease
VCKKLLKEAIRLDSTLHDSKIKPSECGGPVFDQNGKFYGINIARFSRTSSIAVPAKLVLEFLKPVFQTRFLRRRANKEPLAYL